MTTGQDEGLSAAAQMYAHAETDDRAPAGPDAPTPLGVMLATMRWAHAEAERLHAEAARLSGKDAIDAAKVIAGVRALAQGAAKDAAPYVHMRLASFTPSDETTMSHEDWLAGLEGKADAITG